MASDTNAFSRLEARRQEQVPQALARLVVVGLFIALWALLFVARMPMPRPFLVVLLLETAFFVVYLLLVPRFPNVRSIELAQGVMLTAEILFHTTMVYFLGGLSWLGAFAYVFGLIFSNTFLDLRRGFVYTTGASLAFASLILLDATGAIPHYVYMAQGPERYTDARFVTTTLIAGMGVFYSIYLWVNWVGFQLRQERDTAVRAQDGLLQARADLQRANEELEQRVRDRTIELELVNTALRENEARLRTVIENAPLVLFSVDRDGIFTLSEGKGLASLGLDPGEAVGASVFEMYKEVPAVVEHINRALAGEAFSATVDVGDLAFDAHYAPVLDDNGEPVGVIGIATDITERLHAEQALRESEERFRSFAENTQDGVLMVDSKGCIVMVNDATERMFGYAREELLGQAVEMLLPEHLRQVHGGLRAGYDAAASPRSMGDGIDLAARRKDGSELPVDISLTPLRSGDDLLITAVVRDISERKRAEEALRQSDDTLRGTIESTGDGILVLNEDVQVVHVNENFFNIWRMPEELRTTQSLEIYRDFVLSQLKDPDPFLSSLRHVFRTSAEGFDTLELTDGRVFESYSRPLLRDGDAEGRVFSFRDVTQRNLAEEALRDSENKFRTMTEAVAAAVFIYQGTKTRHANSAAEELTGYSRDELLAMDFWEIIHPEYQGMVRERGMARQRGADVPRRYEMKIRTKAGRDKWVDFTAGLVEYEDKPAVLGTAFDISDRKRAEEALREHANRDPLTGLLNRRAGIAALDERLRSARNEGRPFAVLVLDLDRFKSINDTFSHETGDNALLQFAQVMSDLVGDRGVVARLGGDEFEIGLDGFAVEDARAFADRIHADLRALLDNAEGDTVARFMVSIGIACSPDDADSLLQLGRLADKAMYQAKAAGGGRTLAAGHAGQGRAA